MEQGLHNLQRTLGLFISRTAQSVDFMNSDMVLLKGRGVCDSTLSSTEMTSSTLFQPSYIKIYREYMPAEGELAQRWDPDLLPVTVPHGVPGVRYR